MKPRLLALAVLFAIGGTLFAGSRSVASAACRGCAYDSLGGYCYDSFRGSITCVETWSTNPGDSGPTSSCAGMNTPCNPVIHALLPDGSTAGKSIRAVTEWRTVAGGERVALGCRGQIVARWMTSERAETIRASLTDLTF